MNIRKFTKNDLKQVSLLFYEIIKSFNMKDETQEQIITLAPLTDRELTKYLRSHENISYVAQIGNTYIGFIDATEKGNIERLYIHKEFQGKEVAQNLLKKAETEMQKLGVKESVATPGMASKLFFENQGYKVVSEQEKKIRGTNFMFYRMTKKI